MILLDSNAFIWLLYEPHRVGERARQQIEMDDVVLVSSISIWELGLKHAKKKREQPYSIREMIDGVGVLNATLLQLDDMHLARYPNIILPQKDPFDRMLVAQAEAEGCTFLTSDQHILASNYNVLDIRL